MRKALVVLLSVLLFAGCGERHVDDDVFIVVNGDPLTASMVRDEVKVLAKERELAKRLVEDRHFVKWANTVAMKMVGQLANEQLLEQEISRIGLKPTQADVDKVLSGFNRRLGLSVKTPEELFAKFGALEAPFRKKFGRMTRYAAYERIHLATTVSDDIVRQYYSLKTNELQRAARVDAHARSAAAEAYRRLKAGENWEKVADDCSEDKLVGKAGNQFAKEWLWVGSGALGNEELARHLLTMKPGDYTPPIEMNEGLLIIRLVEKKNKLYKLARMMFRMAMPVSVAPDAEAAREQLVAKNVESRLALTLERLEKAAKLEYPMGTNFTYRIFGGKK